MACPWYAFVFLTPLSQTCHIRLSSITVVCYCPPNERLHILNPSYSCISSVLLKFTICCYNQVFEKCPTTSMKFNAMFEAKIRNMTGEVYISFQMLVIFILSTNSTKTSHDIRLVYTNTLTFCLLVGVVDSKVKDLLKVFLYITGCFPSSIFFTL